MDIISSKDMIKILRKTLNFIDERLMHHGERVSYILYKMLQYEDLYDRDTIISYSIAALLHDIGAYKNEEIDNMIQFETKDVWRHSIYGYLFLKLLSPLDKFADIVLYHHLDYNKLNQLNNDNKSIAGYLNLADRIDVSTMNNIKIDTLFMEFRDLKFSGKAIELFQKANAKYHIMEHIYDKTYLEELTKVYEEVNFNQNEKEMFLQMLVYSIDFRSEYTVMHTITTVSVADELARLMRLGEYDCYILHYGALLHDIGKISTPINILEAPRKLTDVEMDIMRNHVKMSEYILRDFIHNDILEIAVRHHEKLDGSGYYRGLKKEELTLPQRILGVADIISALCGKRSYKDSFNKDKVLEIIEKDASEGKICKDTVGCVVEHFDEIMHNVEQNTFEILNKYKDMKKKFENYYKQLQILE